jgi:hypothetical protein
MPDARDVPWHAARPRDEVGQACTDVSTKRNSRGTGTRRRDVGRYPVPSCDQRARADGDAFLIKAEAIAEHIRTGVEG